MFAIPFWLKAAVLLVMTPPIITISWISFRRDSLSGLSRFISYELAVLLVARNLDYTFYQPWSAPQLLSWLLLAAALLLTVLGLAFILGRGEGKYGVEETTKLITGGVFKYVRHPFYAAILFLVWGFFLKHPDWTGLFVSLVTTAFLLVMVHHEEIGLIGQFGDYYRLYMERVKRFVPWVV